MSERTVDVLIADDHPFVRLGVRTLLTAQPDFRVVGEATDGDEAIHLAQQLKPDVLVLDLAMPRLPGLDALREVTAGTASVKTILLTSAIDSRQVLEALQLKYKGYQRQGHAVLEFRTCVGHDPVRHLSSNEVEDRTGCERETLREPAARARRGDRGKTPPGAARGARPTCNPNGWCCCP